MKTTRLILAILVGSVFRGFTWSPFASVSATRNSASVPAGTTGATVNGAALYGSKCSSCHGQNGAGTPAWKAKGQPDLTNSRWQRSRSDEQIAAAIRDGKVKGMP